MFHRIYLQGVIRGSTLKGPKCDTLTVESPIIVFTSETDGFTHRNTYPDVIHISLS